MRACGGRTADDLATGAAVPRVRQSCHPGWIRVKGYPPASVLNYRKSDAWWARAGFEPAPCFVRHQCHADSDGYCRSACSARCLCCFRCTADEGFDDTLDDGTSTVDDRVVIGVASALPSRLSVPNIQILPSRGGVRIDPMPPVTLVAPIGLRRRPHPSTSPRPWRFTRR
jgi:hypothetical protein